MSAATIVVLFAGEMALAALFFGTGPGAWLAGLARPGAWLGLGGQIAAGLFPLLRGRHGEH